MPLPTRYDLAYAAGVTLASPLLLATPKLRGKLVQAWRERQGEVESRPDDRPCVLIHGVSVGETNAARPLVEQLRHAMPQVVVAVAATTATGYARAVSLFGDDASADVFATRFPIDTSAAVSRFFDHIQPQVAVMMELEVWPNVALACVKRDIPLIVANGRITVKSFDGYRKAGPLLRRTFGRVARVLAQEETYADRFRRLGVASDRVEVVGSMKFDAATTAERVDGDLDLAAAVSLSPRAFGGTEPVIVAGSTGPGEEAILLEAYAAWRERVPAVRLVIVPRHPPRFDEVAALLAQRFPLTRRSTGAVAAYGIVLIDTLGELRQAWSMADVAVVGRSLVDLGPRQHGSDLIEPAGLGKPVVHGPFMTNFAEPAAVLASAGATRVANDLATLTDAVTRWLQDREAAGHAGDAGRDAVLSSRGATAATVEATISVMRRRFTDLVSP